MVSKHEQTDFLAELKRLTKSPGFIFGCLLITVGAIGGAIFNFAWHSVLELSLAVVYITALWLLVYDGFFQEEYAKTITALSMFKLSVILNLGITCISFVFMGFGVLFATMSGIMFLVVFALMGSIGYIIVKLYFFALLRMLDSIKSRITTGKYSSLDGLGAFLLLSYIGIGIALLVTLYNMSGTPTPQSFMVVFPEIYIDFYGNVSPFPPEPIMIIDEAVVTPFAFPWGFLFNIANWIGIVLCLRTLKRYE